MYRSCTSSCDTKAQRVPSPNEGSKSPLSLENWYINEFDSWLQTVPSTARDVKPVVSPIPSPRTDMLEISFCPTQDFLNSKYQQNKQRSNHVIGSNNQNQQTEVRQFSVDTFYELPTSLTQEIRIKTEPTDTFCNTSTYGGSCRLVKTEDSVSCSLSQEKIEELQCLAIEQVSKDIHTGCHQLGISAVPIEWSTQDVQAWIQWTLMQYGLPRQTLDNFAMDGIALCRLSEEEFRQRSPEAGDILHAQLEIWKTATNLSPHTNSQPQFCPDDSILDMSGLLNHWINNVPTRIPNNSPNNYSSLLNPHPGQRSPGLLAGPAENALTLSTLTAAASPSQTNLSSDFSSEDLQSDDETSDENCDVERCTTRPGSHSHIHLWQFLKELLAHPQMYGSCIRWLERTKGIFKIEDSVRVAKLWGKRKNRPAMNYDKLSRSIRQYYKKGIMKKTERSQRLVYQFCHPYGQ